MTAVLSDDGRYRYTLEREWMTGEGLCLFVMLNPSTADARDDDPTVRRCIGFAQRWGHQGLAVANLFGYRATDPDEITTLPPEVAIGPRNDEWLDWLVKKSTRVVAAWGFHAAAVDRAREILATSLKDRDVWCLGTTSSGAPRHPLYVKGDTEPVPFQIADVKAAA